ncbi:MAG: response regulator [Elusimicrobiota bacterium]
MKKASGRVIVADRDKDTCFQIKVFLRAYKAKVNGVSGVRECLNKIESFKPDLIIANYMLEKITAYELLEKISSEKNTHNIPVIIMTPEGFDLTYESPGLVDFLTKPFSQKQFINTLKKVMGKRMFPLKEKTASSSHKSSAIKKDKGVKDISGSKILIADDDPNIIKLLELILSNDYDVDIARTGDELVEKGSARHYDLIITDVVMPKASGWKSMRKLRDMDCMSPVIFNSGLVKDKELYETLRPPGPSAFILKPFENKELLLKVKEMLLKA